MSKIWKNIGFFILILACLFNIVIKLTTKTPLKNELDKVSDYVITVAE